ncbi:MAG: type III pantothenate kinase [Bacteroidia bacterium]|nr:type III pantothenate kinase [Bacteroidia bacterium]
MAPNLLLIDIGNTRVKALLCKREGKSTPIALETPEALLSWTTSPIAYIDTRLDPQWRSTLEKIGAEELSVERGFPVPTRYSKRLGPDRAAQLIAVWHARTYPALIISLGTACVIDYIDKTGEHQGGIITAGLHLRAEALAQSTGRLPKVTFHPNPPLWGQDTSEALQAGLLLGMAFELRGWIETFGKLTPPTLWVSGGEAELLRPYLPDHAIFVPDLTLCGACLWWHFLHTGEFPSSSSPCGLSLP